MQKKEKLRAKRHNDNFFVGLLILCAIYFVWAMGNITYNLYELHTDQNAEKKRLEEAMMINESLKAERKNLMRSEHIERVAREELGMTKRDEMPYIVSTKRNNQGN